MLTKDIPADSAKVAVFRKTTAEDTTSGLIMEAVMNVCPKSRKDCLPLQLDCWTYKEISAENSLLFKGHRLIIMKSFITKLFRPSMKATLVL